MDYKEEVWTDVVKGETIKVTIGVFKRRRMDLWLRKDVFYIGAHRFWGTEEMIPEAKAIKLVNKYIKKKQRERIWRRIFRRKQ
jgi:hypothetical protein